MRLPIGQKQGKKRGMKRITLLLAAAAFTAVGFCSCNTAIGFSRDLRSLGTGMENKAHGRTWQGDGGVGGVPAPNPNAPAY
jgi:predicted small secreted protein